MQKEAGRKVPGKLLLDKTKLGTKGNEKGSYEEGKGRKRENFRQEKFFFFFFFNLIPACKHVYSLCREKSAPNWKQKGKKKGSVGKIWKRRRNLLGSLNLRPACRQVHSLCKFKLAVMLMHSRDRYLCVPMDICVRAYVLWD